VSVYGDNDYGFLNVAWEEFPDYIFPHVTSRRPSLSDYERTQASLEIQNGNLNDRLILSLHRLCYHQSTETMKGDE